MKDVVESAPSAGALIPRPKIDLRNAQAIRRELAQVYRDARSGKISTQEATRFAYLLEQLRKATVSSELERRQGRTVGQGPQVDEPASYEEATRQMHELAAQLGFKIEKLVSASAQPASDDGNSS